MSKTYLHYIKAILLFLPLSILAQKEVSPTPTPSAQRIAGMDQCKKLNEASLVSNVKFRNVGPSVMSGRVVDVDVCPTDPTHFYVAYASGGLWVTYNNGQTFTPLFDNQVVMTIGDIAVDWTHGETIWVGTGENNSSRSSYAGVGMFKSTDKGKTWEYKGLGESQHIGRIVIDPSDPNTVDVAVLGHLYTPNEERGMYKTTDGGKTWKKTLFIDNNTGAIDLAMDPTNSKILYAAMWHRERRAWNFDGSGKTSGIYKSIDGGDTWALLTTKESGFPTGDGAGRIGLAVYPKNPNIIYASIDNQDDRDNKKKKTGLTKDTLRTMTKAAFMTLSDSVIEKFLRDNNFADEYTGERVKKMVQADSIKPIALVEYLEDADVALSETNVKGIEVYRSDDAGKTWKRTHQGYLDEVVNTYGYYFGQIRVSPMNPDKIYIFGVPVLKSVDAGKTFRSIDGDNTHGDFHALWLDPNYDGHMIVGSDGGIHISYDDGKTYVKCNSPDVGQFYSVNYDMEKPYNVYGGLQDNGVWYGPSTNKDNMEWYQEGQYPFKRIMGGDGMQVMVDTRDNATCYTGYQFGNYYRVNKTSGDSKFIQPTHKLGERPLRFNWETPIWLSRHNQDILYMGSDRFHRAMNKGDDFETLSPDLTKGGKKGNIPYGTITTMNESALKFGLLYIGTDDGLIYVSQDDGYNWKKISDNLPQNLKVTRVYASNFDTATIYASLSGYFYDDFTPYVYMSKNYGKTWEKIGADLPMGEIVNVVKEDPKNKNVVYVGTDNGLYVSLNRGRSFMHMTGGLPAVSVHDLIVQPRDNDLIVGTHGRSIYIAHVGELQQLNDSILAKDIYTFQAKPVKYRENWGKIATTWSDTVEAKTTFAFYIKEKGVTTIRIKTAGENSILLNTLKDTGAKGLNYFTYDLSIDSTLKAQYQAKLNDDKDLDADTKKLDIADNKKYYLKPGKYVAEVVTEKGVSQKIKFIIKPAEKREREQSEPGK
ncbi:MAG TPA: glycosyl hydrolase [Bacteroidia bacterium]|jgi:photosystem II stability/assembly factor-like uncharacterized protein|nr:glycosyl hydrolase [Bacteroidia bacterium]